MKLSSIASTLALFTAASAFDCSTAAFAAILPANAQVTSATPVAANSTFQVPAGDIAYPTSPTNLQALCAIEIKVTSSNSSAYSFGLFLPEAWNDRFLAVGNGGFIGGINWLDMGAGVGYGFAVMSTDTGHISLSGDLTWSLNEPQKKIDWGYRAMHGSIVLAKSITEAYYSRAPCYSYYSGCSTGGRQGLRDIQLYPEDFDGVLAGAPAWWTSHLQTWTIKLGLYNLPVDAPTHIPVSLFPVIGAEVQKQCDPQDGLVDKIISDPMGCNFYPEALLCAANATNTSTCLTAPQISTLYKIYNDYVETNQTFVFPHLQLGSEAQWPVLLGGTAPASLGTGYVQYFVLNDPNWSYNDFSYATVQLADAVQPGNASATDFDLSPFAAHGGKLLMYHGLADALIATGSSVLFYKQVLKTLLPKGVDVDAFFRFFLVPGMQHCAGTPAAVNAPWYFAGANQAAALGSGVHSVPGFEDGRHDALLALMDWVERGTVVEEIVATKWDNDTTRGMVARQRPLCMFPKQARFVGGKADPNLAESWTCESLY